MTWTPNQSSYGIAKTLYNTMGSLSNNNYGGNTLQEFKDNVNTIYGVDNIEQLDELTKLDSKTIVTLSNKQIELSGNTPQQPKIFYVNGIDEQNFVLRVLNFYQSSRND